MSLLRIALSSTGALALAALLGCSQSQVASHFGEAYRQDVARMVENPDAERIHGEAPQGLDPASAERVVEKYQKRQADSKQTRGVPSIIQIDTGGSR